MTETATRTLWCAYAVVADVRAAIDGMELVGDEDVAVVVGEVPESEFGEDVLAQHLNDREWLERAVTEHESVVRRVLTVATVVPLRFGSLHRDVLAVESFRAVHADEFRQALARVRGRVELGVKVWTATPTAEKGNQAASGREYLEQRRRAREETARARATVDERLRAIHARLLASATEGVLNRPQPRELTGDRREMAMNAAYLVPADDASLLAEVERLRAEHPDLSFEVTGPWAPYNFVGAPGA
ncbi:MAG: GvpL/GvpF family gas vesicle protein [Gaiellaceae bacterium]